MILDFNENGDLIMTTTSMCDDNPYEVLCRVLALYIRKQIQDAGICTFKDFIGILSDEVGYYSIQIPEQYSDSYWDMEVLEHQIIPSWADPHRGDLCDVYITRFNDKISLGISFNSLKSK